MCRVCLAISGRSRSNVYEWSHSRTNPNCFARRSHLVHSLSSGDFRRMSRPPIPRSGRAYSIITLISAVARETIAPKCTFSSKRSRNDSARDWNASTFWSPSHSTKLWQARIFFPTLSRSTTCSSGSTIARGIPGNQPPVPISKILPWRDTNRVNINESTKCLSIIAGVSRIAERLVCALYATNRSWKWANCSITPWSYDRPKRANVSEISETCEDEGMDIYTLEVTWTLAPS